MSYNKSKLQKENKKGFNSSQRKDFEVINAERSSLPLNSHLVWIPRSSTISKHANNIDSSSRTSTKYDETTDNLNHSSLQTNKTYTIVNITSNGSSKEIVPINASAETRQDIVFDRPQKTITTKGNDSYLKKSKYTTDDCSLTIRNEQDVLSITDQCTQLLDDCSLRDRIEDVIQKEKDYEFDIFFINDQHQLDVKKIKI
ncbi:uncharacterized protein LOC100570862 isoform X1 [Acyrthosiphon pisum]|uniref:Uncharacterized protein n=1 Tax=Acyrthosiphon pisum TaxID=7029 RepID=A0A8R1WAQ7_ACYPI|nr:uncharacterized protein LOC100570862 isoform X1 [Acyrthosiphon pisum]|eukprot:XP_003247113.1 PREDICTED: uncharacterized protein LOC100570862 isoform X2 [Acyrthosiphon pisum]